VRSPMSSGHWQTTKSTTSSATRGSYCSMTICDGCGAFAATISARGSRWLRRKSRSIAWMSWLVKVGLFKLERPEIEWWDYREYARVLEAAKREGADWYAAVCLAGEAGLRVGEVRALRWREDVDLVAG